MSAQLPQNGVTINFLDEMVNLTNMWKAVGELKHKHPNRWLGQDNVKEFVAALSKKQNSPPEGIFSSGGKPGHDRNSRKENIRQEYLLRKVPGRNGGTYAHWQIALAYAKAHQHRAWEHPSPHHRRRLPLSK